MTRWAFQLSLTSGISTRADGYAAHAEGYCSLASGRTSHAEGENVTASNAQEHACGRYNFSSTTNLISSPGRP